MNCREFFLCVGLAVVLALVLLPACGPLEHYREDQRRVHCQDNLRRVAQALQMYSAEHGGFYPPIQRRTGPECGYANRGVLMMDGPATFPEYLDDYSVLLCPSDPEAVKVKRDRLWQMGSAAEPCLFDDTSYVYLGWALKPRGSAEDVEDYLSRLYAEGMRHLFGEGAGQGVDSDFAFMGPGGRIHRMFRLQAKLPEAFGEWRVDGLPVTPPSKIPVFLDRFANFGSVAYFNHTPGGSNVLFLDGHVQFIKYNALYPCTQGLGAYLAEAGPGRRPLAP